jgi:hypothetical protein
VGGHRVLGSWLSLVTRTVREHDRLSDETPRPASACCPKQVLRSASALERVVADSRPDVVVHALTALPKGGPRRPKELGQP